MCDDTINHPEHYKRKSLQFECYYITHWLSFDFGNVIKYLWRWRMKNGVEDLKTAQWYLNLSGDREIWRESTPLSERVETLRLLAETCESCVECSEEKRVWEYLVLGDLAGAGKALQTLIDIEERKQKPESEPSKKKKKNGAKQQ